MSISLRYLSAKVITFAQHSLLGFVLLAASWAAAVGAETTEAQTTISNALVETRYSGTLEVYSHARTGNKLDGSYKILGRGGGYIIASLRDGVLEGLWEQYSSQRILLEKGRYVSGRPHGEYFYYTSAGNLKRVQVYDQGVADGGWKHYSRNGNVIENVTFEDGTKVLVERFYNNGTPKSVEPYVDHLKQGVWKTYYPDGTLESEHTYQNDVLTGPSTEFYRSGQRKIMGNIAETGYRHGVWTEYYDSGQVKAERFYNDGREQGPEISFFENGDKKQTCKLNKARTDGTCKRFNDSGRLLKEWTLKANQRHGEFKEYYENGSPENVYHYADGEKSGLQEEYYEGGILRLRENYGSETNQQGEFRLHGSYETFYRNGDPQTKGSYASGKKDGLWQEFSNGRLNKETTYERGIRSGRYAEFYEGRRRLVGSYTDNEKDGVWLHYFYQAEDPHYGHIEEGTLMRSEHWVAGDKAGEWLYYTAKGVLHKREHYLEHRLHGPYEEFDVNSNTRTVAGGYERGKLQGTWEAFYEDGLPKVVENYEKDLRQGRFQEFFDNGQLKIEGAYRSDNKEGKWTEYHQNGKTKSELNFVNNLLEGNVRHYHENGNPESQGPYLRQKKEGLWKFYWPNGELRSEGNYLRGNKTGDWSDYDQFGKLIATRHH